jgi:hypothetical protein
MFVPITRLKKLKERGEEPNLPVRFFRGNKSVEDILRESKNFFQNIDDDSMIFPLNDLFTDLEEDDHCEVFSGCDYK